MVPEPAKRIVRLRTTGGVFTVGPVDAGRKLVVREADGTITTKFAGDLAPWDNLIAKRSIFFKDESGETPVDLRATKAVLRSIDRNKLIALLETKNMAHVVDSIWSSLEWWQQRDKTLFMAHPEHPEAIVPALRARLWTAFRNSIDCPVALSNIPNDEFQRRLYRVADNVSGKRRDFNTHLYGKLVAYMTKCLGEMSGTISPATLRDYAGGNIALPEQKAGHMRRIAERLSDERIKTMLDPANHPDLVYANHFNAALMQHIAGRVVGEGTGEAVEGVEKPVDVDEEMRKRLGPFISVLSHFFRVGQNTGEVAVVAKETVDVGAAPEREQPQLADGRLGKHLVTADDITSSTRLVSLLKGLGVDFESVETMEERQVRLVLEEFCRDNGIPMNYATFLSISALRELKSRMDFSAARAMGYSVEELLNLRMDDLTSLAQRMEWNQRWHLEYGIDELKKLINDALIELHKRIKLNNRERLGLAIGQIKGMTYKQLEELVQKREFARENGLELPIDRLIGMTMDDLQKQVDEREARERAKKEERAREAMERERRWYEARREEEAARLQQMVEKARALGIAVPDDATEPWLVDMIQKFEFCGQHGLDIAQAELERMTMTDLTARLRPVVFPLRQPMAEEPRTFIEEKPLAEQVIQDILLDTAQNQSMSTTNAADAVRLFLQYGGEGAAKQLESDSAIYFGIIEGIARNRLRLTQVSEYREYLKSRGHSLIKWYEDIYDGSSGIAKVYGTKDDFLDAMLRRSYVTTAQDAALMRKAVKRYEGDPAQFESALGEAMQTAKDSVEKSVLGQRRRAFQHIISHPSAADARAQFDKADGITRLASILMTEECMENTPLKGSDVIRDIKKAARHEGIALDGFGPTIESKRPRKEPQ